MKTVQKALNWYTDKQTGRLAYNGISLSDRKEQTTDVYNNMAESQKHAEMKQLHKLWFHLYETLKKTDL